MKKSKKSRKKRNHRRAWPFLLVLLVLFTVSTSVSYLYLKKVFVTESEFIDSMEAGYPGDAQVAAKEEPNRLYEARKDDLQAKDSVVLRQDAMLVVAENIIRKHFEPYKARLLDLYLDKRGILYIDIGAELKRNFKGDAYEELAVIAGLYKNIKSTIPGFTALMLLIEGSEAESFGGHIDLSRPIGEEIAEGI